MSNDINNCDNVLEKNCTKCKKPYPVTDKYWYRNKKTKDGFISTCKVCRLEYQRNNKKNNKIYHKTYYDKQKKNIENYFIENKEQIKKYHDEYEKIRKEKNKKYKRKYYDKNKDRLLKYRKDYELKNKEEISKKKSEWYQKNKKEIAMKQKLNRERKKHDLHGYSDKEVIDFIEDNERVVVIGEELKKKRLLREKQYAKKIHTKKPVRK